MKLFTVESVKAIVADIEEKLNESAVLKKHENEHRRIIDGLANRVEVSTAINNYFWAGVNIAILRTLEYIEHDMGPQTKQDFLRAVHETLIKHYK